MRLAQGAERARRGGGTLSLVLFDLDNLKSVNEEHVHHAGDAYLVHFAEALGRNVRAGDWVARWGGDEFMVGLWSVQEGLPPTTVLERIVRDLREEPVVMTHGEVAKLTFSGGGCRWGAGDDIRGLLSRADDALYRAKADWGNTVVHLDQGGSTSRCNLASMR